jgi:hypothetical protein
MSLKFKLSRKACHCRYGRISQDNKYQPRKWARILEDALLFNLSIACVANDLYSAVLRNPLELCDSRFQLHFIRATISIHHNARRSYGQRTLDSVPTDCIQDHILYSPKYL